MQSANLKMKNDNVKLKIFLLLAVLGAGFVFGAEEARAELPAECTDPNNFAFDKCLQVANGGTAIYRISHPAYDMDNTWKGSRRGFNATNTKVLLNEKIDSNWFHPNWPTKLGRGVVVGDIAALKTAYADYVSSGDANRWLADYLAATKPLNNSFLRLACDYTYINREVGCLNRWSSQEVQWSKIPGEENIIYGLYNKNLELIRVNIIDGTTTVVGKYPAMTNPRLIGWIDATNEVVIDNNEGKAFYGYRMNVITGVYKSYSDLDLSWDTAEFHHAISPNRRWRAHYSGRTAANGVLNKDCAYTHPNPTGYYLNCQTPYKDEVYYSSYGGDVPSDWIDDTGGNFAYATWRASDKWYLAGTGNTTGTCSEPCIVNFKIDQVLFDYTASGSPGAAFTHHPLISINGAGLWKDSTGDYNYASMMGPTMNDAGTMILYPSTDGKYSVIDKQRCDGGLSAVVCREVVTKWGTLGIFLADIGHASGAQTCTSFTYTAWSECQPDSTQTRSVISSSPSGCTGGNPVLTQSCDSTPPAAPSGVTVQ